MLSAENEAVIVAFRRHTLLSLDDCLYTLQPTIPHLTRSSLHRCLQRHGISRLPEVGSDKPLRAKFKRYPIGYFHIDIAEVHTEEGRLYLLVAIDRTSKFASAELHEKITRRVAGNFLRALAAAVPYKIHTVLTDNGTHYHRAIRQHVDAGGDQSDARREGAVPLPLLRGCLRRPRHRAPSHEAAPSLDERSS
nr:DDE-type integrase/transposase/recombinase [Methylobacterium sp. Leaf361]